jgi:Family of unknown function (DUF6334)
MHATVQGLSANTSMLLPSRSLPYRLRTVLELVADGCRQELIFDWGDCYLLVRVDEDTDSLCFQFSESELQPAPALRDLSAKAPWNRWIGKECGWTWVAVNQQGYWDCVLMSFDGIVPTVLLHGLASSIDVMTIVSEAGGM